MQPQHALAMLAAVTTISVVPLLHGGDEVPVFHQLGDGLANDVSDNGSTVVGENGQGFLWTSSGLVGVGGIAAIGVNSDGSFITGDVSDSAGNSAARRDPGGTWIPFGGLGPSGCDSSLSSAYDISGDGSRCVGLGWDGCSAGAFLWTEDDGMMQLLHSGPNSARANCISSNGSIIGGWDEASSGPRRAALWTEVGERWVEELVLEGMSGNTAGYGEVSGSNGDGSIIVGSSDGTSTASSGPFVQHDGGTIDVLGFLPYNQPPVVAGALDTSEDGSTIVGFQREGIGGNAKFTATIWTEDTGLVDLKEYLVSLGADIPASLQLAAAMAVSDDGRVICGWGYDGFIFFQEAWVVVLPGTDVPCIADINGDGMVDGADLTLLLGEWGACMCAEDLNDDGIVDGADLTILLGEWGPCT